VLLLTLLSLHPGDQVTEALGIHPEDIDTPALAGFVDLLRRRWQLGGRKDAARRTASPAAHLANRRLVFGKGCWSSMERTTRRCHPMWPQIVDAIAAVTGSP
jgi:hypothetical protein